MDFSATRTRQEGLGVVTREEMAATLGVSEDTVQRWEERESLPVEKVGAQNFYRIEDVRKWLRAKRRRT